MSDSSGLIHVTIDGRNIAVEPKKKFYDPVQQREFTVDTTIYDAAGHVTPVGEMDSYGALEDDQAADAAVARALAEGWFTLEQRVEFAFEIHWDTTADMRADMEAGHSMRLIRPRFDEVEARRRALSATLHCTRTKLCAVYRKGPGTGPPNRGL